MSLIDLTIEERGWSPVSISIAVRSIGACYGARYRPDTRLITGIGLFVVTPDPEHGCAFTADARCLTEGDDVGGLLDFLELHLPDQGAVISWDNWGSVPWRLRAVADPARHPRIIAATLDTAGRWRDMPRGHTWHRRQARAAALPCLCGPAVRIDECNAVVPDILLPDPVTSAIELADEAIAGWQIWSRHFGDFDDESHPAQTALRALDRWRAEQRPTG